MPYHTLYCNIIYINIQAFLLRLTISCFRTLRIYHRHQINDSTNWYGHKTLLKVHTHSLLYDAV